VGRIGLLFEPALTMDLEPAAQPAVERPVAHGSLRPEEGRGR
jgi:hypothetical protein